MTRYESATYRIERLALISRDIDGVSRAILKDHITALTTIRDGYTLEEAEKEI